MIAPNPNPVSSNLPHPKNFTPLVRQFLDYLKLEKHFSDYTIKSYGADLIQFGLFMAGEIGHANAAAAGSAPAAAMTLEQVDERQLKCEALTIREFLAYLYAQNYTKSTTARKLATLRSFFKFLIRRGAVSVNPLSPIPTPKQQTRLPKYLDLYQDQKLPVTPTVNDLPARAS